jgi:hypothetical protein
MLQFSNKYCFNGKIAGIGDFPYDTFPQRGSRTKWTCFETGADGMASAAVTEAADKRDCWQ